MSRTYKRNIQKHTGLKSRRFAKRKASKAVRRTKHIENGSNYRRCYDSWDIYDCISDMRFPTKEFEFLFSEQKRNVHLRNGVQNYYT